MLIQPKGIFKKPDTPIADFENKSRPNMICHFISLNILYLYRPKPASKGMNAFSSLNINTFFVDLFYRAALKRKRNITCLPDVS